MRACARSRRVPLLVDTKLTQQPPTNIKELKTRGGECETMPIVYERDDARRLITVTLTEPYAVEDIFGAIDRQAAEDTWDYAMLYDLRAVEVSTNADARQLADRVKAV